MNYIDNIYTKFFQLNYGVAGKIVTVRNVSCNKTQSRICDNKVY